METAWSKRFEEFFPGTGGAQETGPPDTYTNPGAHYSLNVPLKDGIDDEQYTSLFRNITGACIQDFDPSAIVLQCGADSLGGDRLGKFNLNITAHADCVDYVKSQCHDRKLLIIGGGGYTPRNVARAWCHETALCTENKLPANLPDNIPFRQAFEGEAKGDGVLLPNLSHLNLRHPNEHTPIYLQGLENNILTQLRYIQGAPSVCMQQIPRDHVKIREEAEARCKEEGEDYDREEAEERRVKLEKNLGGRREYRGI
ncbi:hypothetical protein LTS18_002384 [Coniosporium uncinatum]|uniref:Uncharacterized protein n=1 Tax=Coniosporium uncinatum TaxID=93489 RepID=A0ACC3DDT2_9PEZI|nr:hypothetical protein LTS18_002384 [Coniosporium uncinatum]